MKFKSPEIHQTPKYRAKAAFNLMVQRCENKNGKNPSYKDVKLKFTLEEFLVWAIPEYKKFIKEFPDKIPNLSRLNDSGDYELGNIRILTTHQNQEEKKKTRAAQNGMKICSRCETSKNLDEFSNHKNHPDGKSYWCRSCVKVYNHR